MTDSAPPPLVVVSSLVYNHAPFLHDFFRGILMQKTTFPFYAIVHDDASTDGSTDIIREYAAKYPDIIKPIYETENRYSKHDGSLIRLMEAARKEAKYVALCEGDDYWTDPYKLQKQVDWLEAHPDCSMVCCDGVVMMPDKNLTTHEEYEAMGWPHCTEERDLSVKEIVLNGGWYLHTASLVYRRESCLVQHQLKGKCNFGDYVLQITAALTGKVHFLPEQMVVYRFMNPGSWSMRDKQKTPLTERTLEQHRNVLDMLNTADAYSQHQYTAIFRRRQADITHHLCNRFPGNVSTILARFGYIFRADYLSPAPVADTVRMKLKRFFFYPNTWEYPIGYLLRKPFRYFIDLGPHRLTLTLGHLHICSLTFHPTHRDIYLCGKRLLRVKVRSVSGQE